MTVGEIEATIGAGVVEVTTAGQGRPIAGRVKEATTVDQAQPTVDLGVVITVAVAGGTTFAMSMTIDGKTGAKIDNSIGKLIGETIAKLTDRWIAQTDRIDQTDQIDQTGPDPTSSREK
jgi:hypothetical protein